jgi:hypothetical protein
MMVLLYKDKEILENAGKKNTQCGFVLNNLVLRALK